MEDRGRRRSEIRASAAEGLDRRAVGAVWSGTRGGVRRVREDGCLREDGSGESLLADWPPAIHRIHLQGLRQRRGVGERRTVGLVAERQGPRPVGRYL